ncbi:MAG: UDP-3-O-acyl-N-acetylglucosamine deacetylase [Planctomycetaceae bacterium]|nr:UDP-3-O-acyl-N-acetylglucosamine deacetylase [Planctomycetaceae bacterium]
MAEKAFRRALVAGGRKFGSGFIVTLDCCQHRVDKIQEEGMGMGARLQQTLERTASLQGCGLFGGVDVTLEMCPASEGHGIVFERTDLVDPIRIPALIDYVVPRPRCTLISHRGASVAVIEHVMAALAGMQVDNCLVRINAPEPPACDGSSAGFVELIDRAGIVSQSAPRQVVAVPSLMEVSESDHVGMVALPPRGDEYEVGYLLNYGPGPIPPQAFQASVTPQSFRDELSFARTFVLEQEVKALQAQGIGLKATPQNVMVFGPQGPIENALRAPEECARHKVLDCVGDFALLGADISGRITAQRSGHRLNHEFIRQLRRLTNFPALPSTKPDELRRAG